MGFDRRKLRGAIPLPVRERLYDWNPERRRMWKRAPGVERLRRGAGVGLSFDDGPDPDWTPAVLDALDDVGATATFFVVGERVERGPELTREILARGHELGIHGMEHRRHDRLDPDEGRREVADCAAAIERAGGVRPDRYRPPYGAASPQLAAICAELELELDYWSSWGQDWDPIPAERIARLVLRDLEPGAIVLLHDSATFAERPDPGPTVAAIPLIAAAALERGLTLRSLAAAEDAG
jgi:peptidoglycan-N-acetylglucosamine deacetylase